MIAPKDQIPEQPSSTAALFPNSSRVYVQGKIHPEVKVAMREVSLSPTNHPNGETEANPPVRVYDTSGPEEEPTSVFLQAGVGRGRRCKGGGCGVRNAKRPFMDWPKSSCCVEARRRKGRMDHCRLLRLSGVDVDSGKLDDAVREKMSVNK